MSAVITKEHIILRREPRGTDVLSNNLIFYNLILATIVTNPVIHITQVWWFISLSGILELPQTLCNGITTNLSWFLSRKTFISKILYYNIRI